MANVKQQLEVPSIPSLGFAPATYDQRVFAENNGALNGYFRKLISVLGALFGPQGGKFLNTPHGAFQDSTDQVAASTTVATAITFNTTDFSNGVSISNNSRMVVAMDGIFNIGFVVQVTNTTNAPQDIDIWYRKNGTNITGSNKRFGLAARKSLGDPFHTVGAMNFFVSLVKNDYVELVFSVTDVGVIIEHYATSASPTRPSVPSVFASVNFVSNLPTI